MRMFKAVLAVAVIAATVACSTADTPTGPDAVRGPMYGVTAQSPNGAWVRLEGNACGMVGSDADGNAIPGGPGTLMTKVENNKTLTFFCKGTGVVNLSGKMQVLRDFPCSIGGLKDGGMQHLAFQQHATITRDGDATLSCTATL